MRTPNLDALFKLRGGTEREWEAAIKEFGLLWRAAVGGMKLAETVRTDLTRRPDRDEATADSPRAMLEMYDQVIAGK